MIKMLLQNKAIYKYIISKYYSCLFRYALTTSTTTTTTTTTTTYDNNNTCITTVASCVVYTTLH